MNVSVFFALLFCAIGMVEAKGFDYRRVILAGTGDVGELFVRFLVLSGEPCLIIQNLVSGGSGKVLGEKSICSIDGKKIEEDYAAVDFKNAVFEAGKLVFDVGVTPLQPIGETILSCEVVLSNGLSDHLFCKEKNLLNEGPCTTLRK